MSGTLTIGSLVLTTPTSNRDAFDRLRISQPSTLIEVEHTLGLNPYLVNEFKSGTGASTHISAGSYVQMTVGGGVGKVVRQTYEYIPYQNGKSRLMIFSGVMEINGGVAGLVCRIGSFDNSTEKTAFAGAGNGLFFELNGTTMKCVIRLNNTDTSVIQSLWNFDKFDGNGPSGLTVNDYSKAMIFAIDQEWLGIGRVRFGFFINGVFHVCHVFNHSGMGLPSSTAITTPYTKTAKLPIRYEISNTASQNGEMRMICSTVLSEGGYNPTGLLFSIGMTASKTLNTSTFIPLISLKLRDAEPYNRKSILLKMANIYNDIDNGIIWKLYILPSKSDLNGTTWTSINSENSIAEYNVDSTTVSLTNAVLLNTGYADYYANVSFKGSYMTIPRINSSIIGNSRVLCIIAKSVSGAPKSFASFSWNEIL
jgi:hypothetical protein